jgi:Rad3-related DNA helicase
MLDWRPYFPLPNPRPEQERALDYIVEQLVGQGVNYVIAELGTGVGKSAVAVTVARWMRAWAGELMNLEIIQDPSPQAYVLTSQKILQDQYCNDFPSLAMDLRSSANFNCSWLPGQTCAETLRIKRALDGRDCLSAVSCKASKDDKTGGCPYRIAKEAFKVHPIGVTNYSYFLSETVYAGGLKPRELVVFDEAHNIEGEVRRWATITVREDFSKNELNLPFPRRPRNTDFISWMEDQYAPALAALMGTTLAGIESGLVTLSRPAVMRKLSRLTKKYEMLDKHLCQVNRYIEEKGGSKDNYLLVWDQGPKGRSVEMKPLHITWQARKFLYNRGKKRLLMSATVLNEKTFKRSVGIPDDERCGFISIPSPFPDKNRPVFIAGVGPMVKRHIDKTLPLMADAVRGIIDLHHEEKGIIHCHTYKVAKFLKENINDDRLLVHTSSDRDQVLEQHIQSKTPTILLSPSMTEGVDLKDDRSRFQIVCKVPYPYIGDPVIAHKMKYDKGWYGWITAMTMVQALGRSVRSASDSAVTYILDDSWANFYRQNKRFFPDGFDRLIQRV